MNTEIDLWDISGEIEIDESFFAEADELIYQAEMITMPMSYISESDCNIYMEAIENTSTAGTISKTIDNTKKSYNVGKSLNKDLAVAHGNLTDAGSSLIAGAWKLIMGCITLGAKVINFVVTNIAKIPEYLGKLVTKITSLPAEIKSRLRGDIKLNIDHPSLIEMHSTVIPKIEGIFFNANQIIESKDWNTAMGIVCGVETGVKKGFNLFGFQVEKTVKVKPLSNFKSQLDAVISGCRYLSAINITPTNINMEDPNVIETYFGNAKITVNTGGGKVRNLSFYECMTELHTTLSSHLEKSDNMSQIFSQARQNMQVNNNQFKSLDPNVQKYISDVIKSVLDLYKAIAKIIKAIVGDIKTLSDTYNKITASPSAQAAT